MAFLYNFLQMFFFVFLFPVWIVLLIFNKRLRKGLMERLGFSGNFGGKLSRPSIWIHAASLGEVKVSTPICEALAGKFPSFEMIFSASTPVGKKQARLTIKSAKRIFLLPLDFIWVVCPVVRKVRPRFFLVAETELWPNLFFCLKNRGARIALFNGRISDRSFKRYKMFRFFFEKVLDCVDLFLVQTEQDALRMRALGASGERIHVTGNVKFDADCTLLGSEEISGLRAMLHMERDDIVWVAGSIHPDEFPVLIKSFQEFREHVPHAKWIVIPRHLYAFSQFEEALKTRGLSYEVWNGKEQVPESWNILLVNALGQLIRLYQLGFAAFVGGSLTPIGGHNPLEPLRYGIPTCFGPHMENFREIRDITVKEEVAFEVSTAGEISDLLVNFLEKPGWRREIQEGCLKMFEKYQGATERSIRELEAWMFQEVKLK